MSSVLQFPSRSVQPGAVHCRPLNISFPCLYRFHVNSTEAQQLAFLQGYAPSPGLCLGDHEYTFYSLEPQARDIGTVTKTLATHLDATDGPESLLIRYHADQQSAFSFLHAIHDSEYDGNAEDSDMRALIYETPDGFFTFTKRTTPTGAKGPLLIRMADVPAPHRICDSKWVHITSHEGVELDPTGFGYADLR